MSADPERPAEPPSRYFSPLPPPEVLGRYERECPGSAKRVLNLGMTQARRVMAEERDESTHRRAAERAAWRAAATAAAWQRKVEARGQFVGFAAAVAVLALCAYGFYLGYPQIAASLAGAVVIGLAAVFVNGRRPIPPDKG